MSDAGSGAGGGAIGAVPISARQVAALDAADPLAPLRREFQLPSGTIYLDGNSLGALPAAVPRRLAAVIAEEWGERLIRSWNEAGWIDLPRRAAAKIEPLLGAEPGSVAVADSTSINLFKLLAAALELATGSEEEGSEKDGDGGGGGRRTILMPAGDFPTDLYIAEGLERLLGTSAGGCRLRRCDDLEGLLLGGDDPGELAEVAVVAASHVCYDSGRLRPMAQLTRAAHDAGALMLWDLAHSAGALPVELARCRADLAVGCGYKYLNGGPGAPSFLYVAPRHQAAAVNPLSGWLGHAAPFAFEPGYRPAPGVERFRCGTPPILSLAALDTALDLFNGVDLSLLHAKSQALTGLFLARVEQRCGPLPEGPAEGGRPGAGLSLASPRSPAERGSQISLRHPHGYAIVQALIARGVIGDFRTPDILRFGFAPLYLRYADAWNAAEALAEVLATGEWDREEHRRRREVT